LKGVCGGDDDANEVARVFMGALGDQGVHPLMEGLLQAVHHVCQMDQLRLDDIRRRFGIEEWAVDATKYRIDVVEVVLVPLFTLYRDGVLSMDCLEMCVRSFGKADHETFGSNCFDVVEFSLMCTNLVLGAQLVNVDVASTVNDVFQSIYCGDGQVAVRHMIGFNNLVARMKRYLRNGVIKVEDVSVFFGQFHGYLIGEETLEYGFPSRDVWDNEQDMKGLDILVGAGLISENSGRDYKFAWTGFVYFGIRGGKYPGKDLLRLIRFVVNNKDVIGFLVKNGILVFSAALDSVECEFVDRFCRVVGVLGSMFYGSADHCQMVADQFARLCDEEYDFVCVDPIRVRNALFRMMLLGGSVEPGFCLGRCDSVEQNVGVAARMSITSGALMAAYMRMQALVGISAADGGVLEVRGPIDTALRRLETCEGLGDPATYKALFDEHARLRTDVDPAVRAFVLEKIKAAIGMLPIGLKVHVSRDGNDRFNPAVLGHLLKLVGVSGTGGFKLDDADTALIMHPFPSYGQLKLFLQYLGAVGITDANYAEFQLACPGELDNSHAAYLGAALLLSTGTNCNFILTSFYTNRPETRGKLIIPGGGFRNLAMPFMPESLKNSSDRTDVVCRLDLDDAEIVQWVHTMLMYHQLGIPLCTVTDGRVERDISEYWMRGLRRMLVDARLGGVLEAPWIRGSFDKEELLTHFRQGVKPCVDAWKYNERLCREVRGLISITRAMFVPRQKEILASGCKDVAILLKSVA